MIYLDNAATTYPKPREVYEILDAAQKNIAFNAGRGNYSSANEAHNLIASTRSLVSKHGNAKHTIFTASATHALNQIIGGLDFESGDIIYFSPYDHNAIVRTLTAYTKEKGIELKLLPLNENYEIDLEKMKFMFMNDKPNYVFSTHVSNVTGYILPVKEIGELVKKYNGIYVVDGAQAFGLVDVNITSSNIDYYVFAGHKTLYGPFGIAGYMTNDLSRLKPSFFGGTGTESLNIDMPINGYERFEPSSPNVVAIAGMQAGANWVFNNKPLKHEQELYKYTLELLEDITEVHLYGANLSNYTGIISFNLDGYKSEELSSILSSDFDIAVRGGYHCCPLIHDILDTKKYLGTVRISFSQFNTKEDIDVLVDAIKELIDEM